jgi:cytochrome c oxidase subunit 3
LTVVLGVGFLVSQLIAWRQLAKQGVYIASNPHSSFFYLFTATHGVHLLGGLTALSYLSLRSRAALKDKSTMAMAKAQAKTDAVTIYWHFMDFLWLYLFVLLFYVR